MNIPASDARARAALDAAADVGPHGETQLFLFGSPSRGEFDVRRVNPTQAVANKFRELGASWATSLRSRTLVPYAPGRRPDDHELAFLLTDRIDLITNLLASVETPVDVTLFEPAFARQLRFYLVSVRVENPGWIHFFKAKGETLRLKRTPKVALVPSGGAYGELESDPLVFDATFDAVIAPGCAIIANQPSFERALQFVEQASAAAATTLTQLLTNLTISNATEFLAAATSDINMIAKLRSIAAKIDANPTYADVMTTARVIQFANERGIPIDTEEVDGERQLVFHPDPQHRWRILKLLDDDYLHSPLTQLDYEVNSKSTID